MAKAGVLYVGTDNGLYIFSDPGGTGRWRLLPDVALANEQIIGLVAADSQSLVVATKQAFQRSDDGGRQWQEADAEDRMLFNFLNSQRVPVATVQGMGVWRHSEPPLSDCSLLAVLSGKQEVLLAVTAEGKRMLRSDDGGKTWQDVSVTFQGRLSAFAPSSYHIDVVWAGTDTGQILRSDDRGRSWQHVGNVPHAVRCLAAVRVA
ncbi:MAG TPA: hypothetical protein DEF43_13875 [Chloroflexus aurantiacus]|jgi:photosystem II stability/assembly factor-like uncharacterized protein|uniref:Glycosyl hydrolase BNR repeat-containing protein n=1 Tax=Chloroflexus aurantiacus (strain ATCC 29366 / DSM 635 / J-10-fl) TaxID=324602 RepID=A9WEB3_CHLAA|nr:MULTISPECIES: sialidase family protein [Chloroflexus]ABY33773.1 hypothetical protein Caur_0526 [Chloroflexus aurantiacus J-10-fl]RMG52797.1 MAG: hypothetical protein D6716_02650 [Chloroflexota bacterium]GIV94403.1 MAG: hypothetical protein KatS3mg056_3112 [Chloroflexus sp.]HBW68222.1 hypothetical protein [Chloroflexus aurantiacus]